MLKNTTLTQLEAKRQLTAYQFLKYSSENCWETEPASVTEE